MAVKNKILAIPLISFDAVDLTADYQALNPLGLPNACFQIKLINLSSFPVTISYDGIIDHDVIINDGEVYIPTIFSSQPNTNAANFATGTIIYLKGNLSSGSINLVGYYQPQGV